MVNEFFKSISRTLGRVFAYALIGFLIYFVISCFKVNALSFTNGNPINIMITDSNNNQYALCSMTQGGNQSFCPNNRLVTLIPGAKGFWQYDITSEPMQSNNQYLIEWKSTVVLTEYVSPTISNLPTYAYVMPSYSGSSTSMSCDEDCSYTVSYIGQATYYIQSGIGGQTQSKVGYAYNLRWYGKVNSSSTWNYIYFYLQKNTNNVAFFQALTDFSINNTSDPNQSIIDNDNKNTQSIINNNNQNTERIIQSQNDNTNAINDLNDTMTDESPADFSVLEDIKDYMPSNTPVTDIIFLPLTILNTEINSLGNSCSAWTINFGSFFNNYVLTIPCINPGNYLSGFSWGGYTLWQLIDFMIVLYMGYEILMLIIFAYNSIMNLDDTFGMQYVPKHAKGSYQPRHAKE